jgi:hypothetical protein
MSPLFFAAAAAAASVAAAPTPAPAPIPVRTADVPASGFGAPPTKQEAAGDPNEMICKRIVSTGTRFASKDCRTRSEWNQLAVDSRQATHDLTANQGGLTTK